MILQVHVGCLSLQILSSILLQSSVLVMLNITDANDHGPIFSQTSYNVTIEENYYGLLSSLAVKASDQDSGENGEVTYTIVGGSSVFSINPKTVRVLGAVWFELSN